jgi:hypothetical protein
MVHNMLIGDTWDDKVAALDSNNLSAWKILAANMPPNIHIF